MAEPKRQSMQHELARFMLAIDQGSRIPPVSALSKRLGVGSGTVQTALGTLVDAGAIRLTARGHLGTTLSGRDPALLWQMSGSGPVECSMPLPISLEMSSIATAFKAGAAMVGVDSRLSFFQGAHRRMDELRHGLTDAVVGSTAALSALKHEGDVVESLDDYSFYARDSVVVITRRGEDVNRTGRIPIDRRSFDHGALTQGEFPGGCFVDASYPLIPEMIVSDECDAAIWHQSSASPLLIATGISIHPLVRLTQAEIEPLSRAAVVSVQPGRGASALVHDIITHPVFDAKRRAVLNREAVPEY